MLIAALMCGGAWADASVSAAFTFDARYQASGQTPSDWEAYEVAGLSDRFSAATVTRAVDANANGIPDVWENLHGLTGEDAAANADPDGDGRTNLQEYNAGTNPVLAENYAASQAVSAAHIVDTWIESAFEGWGGLTEVWAISSMFLADTVGRAPDSDKDGLPDWFEKLYGLDPSVADAHLDPDGDGRTNLQEYNAGTNPILIDDWTKSIAETSEAFETDTRVYYTGGNPTFDDAFAVIKISNGFICDTGGLYYDWDGDGIPNWWEKRFARDGSKTGLVADVDDDGDGAVNYAEFVAYTDPTDVRSKFAIGIVPILVEPVKVEWKKPSVMALASVDEPRSETAYKLTWQSAKGRTYDVYTSFDLSKGWETTPLATIKGTGDVVEYVPPVTKASMLFRVTVRLSY